LTSNFSRQAAGRWAHTVPRLQHSNFLEIHLVPKLRGTGALGFEGLYWKCASAVPPDLRSHRCCQPFNGTMLVDRDNTMDFDTSRLGQFYLVCLLVHLIVLLAHLLSTISSLMVVLSL
jgi:hypothetical protein